MSPTRSLSIISSVEFRAIIRRRWFLVTIAVGAALIVTGTIFAGGRNGIPRFDALRSWTLAVEVLGGLVVSACLGASVANRDADGGWFGLQVATGTTRAVVTLGRVLGRVLVLVGTFAVWMGLAWLSGLLIGNGSDWPLIVTGFAGMGNMLVVLTVAAVCSVALGPVSSGVMGVLTYIFSLALVNMSSAAEADVIGTSWSGLISSLYFIFPRGIVSPLVADLQARDVAGLAAPQVEVNGNIVFIQPASWATVIWTLGWCVLLALAAAGAMRRRALS